MFDLPGPLGTIANFLVIVAGFGFIIFIHELGHFLAAKWAGIRVLAFSIGFGQVVCSYRKGIGFRRGSSEHEYIKRVSGLDSESVQTLHQTLSPTEYRLSWLPLGGYVKMLGQEDLNPDAVSDEPDSYQNCSVPKRMVVISAGVIMNVISAAILFIVVFNAGLRVFPARVGFIAPDGPAAHATPVGRADIAPGLQRGDLITEINGKRMYSFEHILPEIAMSPKGQPVSLIIEREGVEAPIEFSAMPIKSNRSGLLGIQIDPPMSVTIAEPKLPKDLRVQNMFAAQVGLADLQPGDQVIRANGQPIRSPFDLLDIATASSGEPISIELRRDEDAVAATLMPVRQLQQGFIRTDSGRQPIEHVLGLTGVMMVNPDARQEDTQQGLMPGDIFAQIGSAEFPGIDEGLEVVHANRGKPLAIQVLRQQQDGSYERVRIDAKVHANGTVGFYPALSSGSASFVGAPLSLYPAEMEDQIDEKKAAEPLPTPAMRLIEYPGSRIISIEGTEIQTLRDIPEAVIRAAKDGFDQGQESFSLRVMIELPLPRQPDGTIPTIEKTWTLSRSEIEPVLGLGWTIEGGASYVQIFKPDQIIDRSPDPISAINRGIAESRRVMLQTYLTFLRLFQGSVQVKHFKGPVGIAHLGTQIASQGWVWVLFFMALISINLAVINFLPLPIVDGGQFLMLLYEWIRGKPVPIVFQNVATMAGLLLIGFMFLYVTFNDIKNLFGV